MSSSQKRAIQNYRARLSERGLTRFEVLGLGVDRDLIRLLARRLAQEGPEASQLRAAVNQTITGAPPKKGGILKKPAGKRRDLLDAWFAGPQGPRALFAGRVLSCDEKAALLWARLMADGKAKGRPRSALDAIIASVAEANQCIVVTGNEQNFAGIEVVNPLRESAR